MKESYAMRLAQYAVLKYSGLEEHEKLEVLRVLFDREETALLREKFEAEQAKEKAE